MTELLFNFARVLAQLAPFLLLGFLAAGWMHVLLPVTFLRRHLGRTGLGATVKAALFGVPLPLCSCGVIPVAVELRKGGASRGATASFLVATPETGVDSIAVSVAFLHPLLVLARPLAALLTAIAAGTAVERWSAAPEEPATEAKPSCCHGARVEDREEPAEPERLPRRLLAGLRYGFVDLFREVGRYLLPAALVTAAMTTFLEPRAFASIVEWPWLQMVILLAIGIPVYVCATGATPVAAALIVAGFSPGAALVFLLVGPATNLVTITAAARTLGKRGALVYCLAVAAVSFACGLLTDALFAALRLDPARAVTGFHDHLAWWHWSALVVLAGLFCWHGFRAVRASRRGIETPVAQE